MYKNDWKIVVLSQVVAVMIKNIMILSNGMILGYTTILIPGLSSNNPNETFSLSEDEISWIGSSSFLYSLIGSILSCVVVPFFGRKRIMMILTVPVTLSWITYYFANQLWHIFVALGLGGISSGLIKAPVLSYVVEVTEPNVRGMLAATSTVTAVFGTLTVFFIGTLLHWRFAALAFCIVPTTALFFLYLIPESPYWLLSHNRCTDAQLSLAWLRGWTTVANVEQEFEEMKTKQTENENSECNAISNTFSNNENNQNMSLARLATFKKFTKKSFWCPFLLVSFIYFLSNFTGGSTLQTYSVVICATLEVPMDKYYATVILGSLEFVGSALCMIFVRYTGKRVMGIASLIGVGTCDLLLGIYSYSKGIEHLNFNIGNSSDVNLDEYRWIPLVIIILLAFLSHCGITSLPWILVGEIFSTDSRALGCGLATAVYAISGFLSNKIYLNMVSLLSFSGVYWFYTCLSFLGVLIIYVGLPETEGKTLQEISDHFRGHTKLDNKVRRAGNKISKVDNTNMT